MKKDTTKSTRNTKNIILAIPTALPAIPPKPRTAAMSAITKKVIAQEIMIFFLLFMVKLRKAFRESEPCRVYGLL